MGDLSDLNFNASNVEPQRAFEPVPPGDYRVVVMDAVVKDTKAGNGKYLKLQFEIIDPGQVQGRYLWTNINTVNPNEKAVEIGHAELSAFCRAIDITELSDTTQFIGKSLMLGVGVNPDGYKGNPENEVLGYAPSSPASPRANTVPAQTTDRTPPPTTPDEDLPF